MSKIRVRCAKDGCFKDAIVRGFCNSHYARARLSGHLHLIHPTKGSVIRNKIDPERILKYLATCDKPKGSNRIVAHLFGYENSYHPGVEQALKVLMDSERIRRVKWGPGTGYVLNKEAEFHMQYTISAKVPQKDGATRNTIETDLKPRAIHLANVFKNNGWNEVKIEVGGKEYLAPWGDVP